MDFLLIFAFVILLVMVPRDKLRFVLKKIILCLLLFIAFVVIYYVVLVVIEIILLWALH